MHIEMNAYEMHMKCTAGRVQGRSPLDAGQMGTDNEQDRVSGTSPISSSAEIDPG